MAKKIILAAVFTLFAFGVGLETVQAATLYFVPSTGASGVGGNFSVGVYVSSANQAMNAASGVVSFPQDKLEVASISKTGSIITLWVQEPASSNQNGTVNFEGIVPNPGFTGSAGKIITLNFRTKAAGTAALTFSSGSVLANDGLGTNILTGLGSASFSLGNIPSSVPEAAVPLTVAGAPAAPEVRSSTHPDSSNWYQATKAVFNWDVPEDVTAVRLLVGQLPQATPTVTYSPPITSKEVDDFEDGIWYFHAQFKNKNGWGGIAHFRFQIDTQPPDPFSIEFVHGKEIIDPSPIINFNTTDALSGIRYYKIKIGSGDFFEVDPNLILSNPYSLPPQDPGKNTVVVQAYDKAGNTSTAAEEFEILALESPQITRYEKNIVEGDLLEIGGETYPDSDVDLFLFQGDKKTSERRIKSNSSGDFTFIWSKKLESGAYDVQAQVTDNRGAKSLLSEKITIVVAKSAIFRVGGWAIDFLAVVVPLVALVFILLFLIWYGWHKLVTFRKRVKKEAREAEQALHKALNLLKEDIREQIKMLEKIKTKRQLTEEEEKIIKRLKKDLDDAERFVKKEIEDIEKVVKQ
ncbi:MAG: hypothetical protein V2A55_00555 [Candidatus Jorgensenbacteria bacterium]